MLTEIKDKDSMPWEAQKGVDVFVPKGDGNLPDFYDRYLSSALMALRQASQDGGFKFYFDLGWRKQKSKGGTFWRKDWLLSNGEQKDGVA